MRRFLILLLMAVCAACTAPPTPAVPSRLLGSWQPMQDALTQQDDARAWRFDGLQGDALHLHLDAKSGGQVTLALQDSSGNTLAQGDDFDYRLPASGFYTALVRLISGQGTTYSLTLTYTDRGAPTATPTDTPTPSDTPTPTPTFTPSDTPTATNTPTEIYAPLGTLTGQLQVGQTVAGSYLSVFERHIYTFEGSAGQQVTISMSATSGTVDPVLTLFDPSGQPLATDDNSGGGTAALLRNIRLPVDGTYIIQALGGGTGGYQISLQASAPPPNGQPSATPTPTPPLGTATPAAAADGEALQDHVPVIDVIDQPGAFHRYFINAQAGDILTVSVRPVAGSALQPSVEVYTPDGEELVSAALGREGEALIPGLGVIEAGKYGVYVSDANNTTGAYVLAYGEGTTDIDDLRGGIAPETPARASGLTAVRDEWTLPLIAGDVIDVEARGAALQVVAPDGTNVGGARDTVQISAALTGDYRVYATGSAYTVLWRYQVTAPTPPAPLLILSADDSVPAQTYLYYPFQGSAGRRIHIRVEAETAGFDPVAALFDPGGDEIAEGDDSPNSLNPDFQALLPVDGTYTLRVNAYGSSSGSVNVTIEMLS